MDKKEEAICPYCERRVLTSYVRRNNGDIRQWSPIGFWCDNNHGFIPNDQVVYQLKQKPY
jgi:hypothetical protein